MDPHFRTARKIPAAMALLILPSFLTGCGLTNGFGVGASPASGLAVTAPNPPAPSPKVARRPAPIVNPPTENPVAAVRAVSPQSEPNSFPPLDPWSDGQQERADTNAQFVTLKSGHTVEDRVFEERVETPRSVVHAGDHDFDEKVVSSDETVLVDFYADWCGPCKRLAPVLDDLARETTDAKIVKVNIDSSPRTAQHYGVRSIPTLIVFKDGKPVTRRTGLNSKSTLKALIAQ
jgi:thioredoxin 1